MRQLGPEQLENQRRIRTSAQTLRERLEQVEEHVAQLKEQALARKLGRPSLRAPSLDAVHRAMRNISAAAEERSLEIDELATRVDLMRLSSAKKHRSSPAPLRRSMIEASPATPTSSRTTSGARDSPLARSALAQERRNAILRDSLAR